MSERGSFITEFIYCDKCLDAATKVLLGTEKYLDSKILLTYDAKANYPIIAGKVGGLYVGEELVTFEFTYIPTLEKTLCHELRIAVLAEVGQEIFIVKPENNSL